MSQPLFYFDPNRCVGCHACALACNIRQQFGPPAGTSSIDPSVPGREQLADFRRIYGFNEELHPELPQLYLSQSCNHCEHPICVSGCPAAALRQQGDSPLVILHSDRCIGCKYCQWLCPYDAPRFREDQGVMGKCDYCEDRVSSGDIPECVKACPVSALRSGPAERESGFETDSDLSPLDGFTGGPLKPKLGLTAVRYRGKMQQPQADKVSGKAADPEASRIIDRHFHGIRQRKRLSISKRVEWSLFLFTAIITLMVVFFSASLLNGTGFNLPLFMVSGGAAMLLSLGHLGRKLRFYRAVLNIKRSWLSREVLLFSLFFFGVGLKNLIPLPETLLNPVLLLLGWGALLAVDQIYKEMLLPVKWVLHSGSALFNGLYLLSWISGSIYGIVVVGGMKLLFYLIRQWKFRSIGGEMPGIILWPRILCGFVIPGFLLWRFPDIFNGSKWILLLSMMLVILGDLLDRYDFYRRLAFMGPEIRIGLNENSGLSLHR